MPSGPADPELMARVRRNMEHWKPSPRSLAAPDQPARSSTYGEAVEWIGAHEPDGEEFLGTHEDGEPPR